MSQALSKKNENNLGDDGNGQGPAAAKQATAVPRPRSPRSGVMRPGAAKRAQAAPHVTAYAAAMIKKRVLEIFNELMAGDAGEGASAAAGR